MATDDLVPPEMTDAFTDHMTEGVSAVMSCVPGLNLLVSQIILIGKRSREKKVLSFLEKVASELFRLSVSVDEYARRVEKSEKAIEIIHLAINQAQMASEPERIEALKNAAINSALDSDSDVAREKIFIRYLQDFTDIHLRLMTIFRRPLSEFERLAKKNPFSRRQTTFVGILRDLVPETQNPLVSALYRKVVRELYREELLSFSDLDDDIPSFGIPIQSYIANPDGEGTIPFYGETKTALSHNYLTPFGAEFMRFISRPSQNE